MNVTVTRSKCNAPARTLFQRRFVASGKAAVAQCCGGVGLEPIIRPYCPGQRGPSVRRRPANRLWSITSSAPRVGGSCSRQAMHHAQMLVSQHGFSAHHKARFLPRLAPAARPSAVSAPSPQFVAFNSEPIQSTVVLCKRRLRFSTMATPNHSVKPTA